MGGRRLWGYRAGFAAISAAILFYALLPFGRPEGGWPGPELTLCVVIAWVLRRPDYVPLWLMVPILLLDDALLMRPLGLWTLIVLLVTEFLRRGVDHAEALPFSSEMSLAAGWITAAFVANHLALMLLLAETPPLWGQAFQMLVTILCYPIVAVASQLIGVRRLGPGELDSLGARA
jgi:rod shape-determining protein MreD